MFKTNRKPDKERLFAAFLGEKTGEVPHFEITINPRGVSHFLNKGENGGWWGLTPEESISLARIVGQDMIPCAVLKWSLEGKSVLSEADLDKKTPPGPDEMRRRVQPYSDAVSGTEIGLLLCLSGPFTTSSMSAAPSSTESFMYMLYDNPELAGALMDLYTRYSLDLIEATADMAFDMYYIGDDIGGLIGPDFIANEWAPRMGSIIKAAQDTGRMVMCHCCGDQTDVLPWFEKWGVNAVHPLQPKYNDIYAVRKQYPDITLVGNIDIDILTRGTKEEIVADTMEHLERLAPSGRYVASSSHSIIDSVPPENFELMLETVQEYKV